MSADEIHWRVVNGVVHTAYVDTQTGIAYANCTDDNLGVMTRKKRHVKAPRSLVLCTKCMCGEVEIVADAKTVLAVA